MVVLVFILWRHTMMSPTRFRRAPYLILSAALALGLSSCVTINKSDKAAPASSPKATSVAKDVPTAKAVYDEMRKNVKAATSVRIKGTVLDAGKTIKIDIAGDRDGKNTRALVNDGTGQAELLTAGGNVYIKADAAYWAKNGSGTIAKIAGDKYVKIPAGTGMDTLKVGTLLDGAFTDLPLAGALQKVEPTDLAGVPAYLLSDRVGGEAKIYVSADGEAQLMRIVSVKTNPATLDFSQWNDVPPMSPPPASQLVKVPGLS
jgi:hypothetical protein